MQQGFRYKTACNKVARLIKMWQMCRFFWQDLLRRVSQQPSMAFLCVFQEMQNYQLGGGFNLFFYFHPENWVNFPF